MTLFSRLIRRPAAGATVLLTLLAGGCGKKQPAESGLERGRRDFAEGRYDDAEVEFSGYLNGHLSDRESMLQLGTIYFFQGRWLQAASMLAQAYANGATDYDTNLRLAQCRARFSQWTEAMARAERAVKERPSDEDAWIVYVGGIHDPHTFQRADQTYRQIARAQPGLAVLPLARALFALKQADTAQAEAELRTMLAGSPRSAAAWEQLARLLTGRGELEEAEKAFAQAASLSPPRSSRQLAYAEFEVQHDHDAKAKAAIEGIIAAAPDFIPALTAAANLAFKQGQNEECQKMLQRVLARDGINYEALMMKANLAMLGEHPRDAVVQFEHVDDIYPDVASVKMQLSLAFTRVGDLQSAEAALKKAVLQDPGLEPAAVMLAEADLRKGDLANAETVLVELLRRKPEAVRGYFLLGSAYLKKQDFDHALTTYRSLERMAPHSAEAIYLEASVLAHQGRLPETRAALERSVLVDQSYAPAVEALIDLDLVEKAVPAARARADRLEKTLPKSATPWLLRAKIALALKQTHEAEADFLRAIDLEPKQPNAYLLLANLYVQSNEYPRAIQKLTAIVDRTQNIRALMELATIRAQLLQYREAAAYYERVVKLDPTFATALNNLAYLYCENLNDPDKAVAYARRAREMAPANPSTADTLGWALFRRGNHAEAFTLILEAADQSPGDAEVQYHLGMAESMLSDPASARVALAGAVHNGGGASWVRAAQDRLALLDGTGSSTANVALLTQRLVASPTDPLLRSRLGDAQLAGGNARAAADQYEQALKLNPRNTAIMLKLARVYADQLREPTAALEMAKRVHVVDPSNDDGSRLLGHLLFAAGKYSWSRDIYGGAADTLDAGEKLELAEDDFDCGQLADAAATLEGAGGRAADLLRICFAAADDPALATVHEHDAAELLQIRPGSVVGRLILAEIVESGGRVGEAVHRYQDLLSEAPSLFTARLRLAILQDAKLGSAQSAFDSATLAKQIRPDDTRVLNLLASISFRRGDYERAAVAARQSLSSISTNSVAHYYLGVSNLKLGRRGPGEAELRTAIAQGLEPELAAEARRQLGE